MAEEVVIRSKDIYYRGKLLDQLKALDVRESAKYLPSRSRRSVLRHFDKVEKFIKLCEKKIAKGKRVKTHLRDMVIVPKMVGMTIHVYNGKSFLEVPIKAEMLGHRLGEFNMTRQKVNHGSAGIGATKSSKAQKK